MKISIWVISRAETKDSIKTIHVNLCKCYVHVAKVYYIFFLWTEVNSYNIRERVKVVK